ncbi:hypothetical protein ACFL2Y_04935 [Candidatus Omnitrophota bacterium]
MNNEAKTSVIFVILLLLLSLGATSFYYISYEKEKEKSNELAQRLNLAQEEKEKIGQKLRRINDEKISLESKIKENQNLIAKLNDKLTQEIEGKELLKQEQEGLRNKIIEISQERKNVQEALDEKLKEIVMLQNKLDDVVSQRVELEDKIAGSPPMVETLSLEESPTIEEDEPESGDVVDLEKIVVASISAEVIEEEVEEEVVEVEEEPKRPTVSGEVLLINKEYSFIVINVGAVNGVEEGDAFEISHIGIPLGQVRIEKVHERMSAANLLPGLNIRQVKEGDTANRID